MHKNTVPADVTEATDVEPDFACSAPLTSSAARSQTSPSAPTAATVVATHYGDGNVSVIDAYAMTVEADIEMPVEPLMVTASASGAPT